MRIFQSNEANEYTLLTRLTSVNFLTGKYANRTYSGVILGAEFYW